MRSRSTRSAPRETRRAVSGSTCCRTIRTRTPTTSTRSTRTRQRWKPIARRLTTPSGVPPPIRLTVRQRRRAASRFSPPIGLTGARCSGRRHRHPQSSNDRRCRLGVAAVIGGSPEPRGGRREDLRIAYFADSSAVARLLLVVRPMLADRMWGLFSSDLAIDLGTANTLVFVRGRGIVLNEPSIIAIRKTDNSVIGVGHQAKAMLGRTPENIMAIRPLRDGVIADFDVTERMLKYFIERARKISGRRRGWFLDRPRVVVGVPSGITQVEKRAVRDAALQAGAREVYLIEEPTAAAIGAGLPIHEPGGHLIVDIGGGTTEVAVISMSGTVYCNSVRIAGDEMDEAIIQHIRKHYRLLVGERRAEEIKIALGSAHPLPGEPRTIEVKGRDLVDGMPKTIIITAEEIREALREPVMTIVEAVLTCLEQTPPELAADIVETGVVLTGGGALLRGLDRLLQQATHLPVRVAEDPLSCAARGVGKALDDLELLKKVAIPA